MMLLLYPGAGSSSTHPSLVAIEQSVAPQRCVRADFTYRKQGRRAPDRAPVLLAAIREEIALLESDQQLVIGGRSMGGRMCSMIAAGVDGQPPPTDLVGLVLISYPLHPPGRPDRLRVEHLPAIQVPTLFVSGTRDAFGTPDELSRWTATMSVEAAVEHVWLDGKGHDLKGADQLIADAVAAFVGRLTVKSLPGPQG